MKKTNFTSFIIVLSAMLFSLSGHAQEWTLLNPYPTFNNIYSVSFPSPDTGYIVGDNSTVMRTFDGGETWTELDFPVDNVQLRSVNFGTNNRGIIVAWSYIGTTTDAGETWNYTQIQLNSDFIDSFFLNDTLGWVACGSNKILKTTDGGMSWTQSSGNLNAYGNIEIAFANADTGYIAGFYNMSTDLPKLRRSVDGGQNWENFDVPAGIESLAGLAVIGTQDVWVGARNHMLNNDSTGVVFKAYHTTDGGQNWTTHIVGPSDGSALNRIKFFNANEGRFLSYSRIYSTSDGGATWSNYDVGSTWNSTLADFSWADINNCAIVGYGPEISITKDGGLTWENKVSGITGQLRSIYFSDVNNGFIGGIDISGVAILKTNDSGNTWTHAQIDYAPGEDQISELSFVSPASGWASTFGPYVYNTTDGGQTWKSISTGFDYNLTSLSVTSENDIFLADGNARVVKSNDGGESWQEVSPVVDAGLYLWGGMVFTDNATGFVGLGSNYNNRGKLLKTIDGGASWTEIDYGYTYNIQRISFSDSNHGIINIQGIGIMVTQDGGQNWSEPVNIAPYISFVRWMDANHGLAAYQDTFVAYTEDGGYTWTTTYQQPTAGGNIQSTYFLDEHTGWVSGSNGLIMRYNETFIGLQPVNASNADAGFFYPNPAGDIIHLEKYAYDHIRIYTVEGSLVQSYSSITAESLNISTLKSGIYIVVANTTNGILRQKLLKK